MSGQPTPGRPQRRSGVFLSPLPLLLAALLALGGCDSIGDTLGGALGAGATIQLDSGEVQLGAGAEVHDIHVGGFGATDSIAPAAVEAEPGDAVRFVADDARTHALTFIPDSLQPDPRAFLERTAQLRGPPLVSAGAAWVVLLEGAPPGRYPFYCRSHDAAGVLVVRRAD